MLHRAVRQLSPALAAVLAAALPAQHPPARLAPLHEIRFDAPSVMQRLSVSDPDVWQVADGGLLHRTGSKYRPVHRSPHNLAVWEGVEFGSFVLDCEVEQTGRDYGHRDLCLFFGIQDREHFYYAHLATQADPNAHHVQIVNGAARTPITTRRSDGIDWGRGKTHRLRVERDLGTGRIRVFFDDMDVPVLEAEDRTFGFGRIGFGSFDDEGRIESLQVRGHAARRIGEPLFAR